MKRVLVLISIFMLCALSSNAQDYLISFAGTGASTTIETVKIINLTRGLTLEIQGSDVLRLNVITSIDDIKDELVDGIHFYPNPIKDQARMQFVLPEAAETMITLYDISGKIISQTRDFLPKGQQTYRIQGIREGIYFASVNAGRFSVSGRLICSGAETRETKIIYENTNTLPEKQSESKSMFAEVVMQYVIGDRLLLRGISGNYSMVLTDIPTSSKTITFNFIPCSDASGNNYSVLQIGSTKGSQEGSDQAGEKSVQTWMGENLKTTKYRNGDLIETTTPASSDISGELTPKYQWGYNGEEANISVYGRLYTWYTVTDPRSVCPDGWHVPTDADWTALTNYLGGEYFAGSKLKETGFTHWIESYLLATNETGFTALPGGSRSPAGNFLQMRYNGVWWSATEKDASTAWYRLMDFLDSAVTRDYFAFIKKAGLSVRCIKD